MNLSFIFALVRFSCSKPFTVSHDIIFSDDHQFIDEFLKDSKVGIAAGEQRITMLKANPFAVYQNEVDNVNAESLNDNITQFANAEYQKVANVVNSLWFIKDCCVSISDSLHSAKINNKEVHISLRMATENYCMADGDYSTVDFEISEVEEAIKINNKLIEIIAKTEKIPLATQEMTNTVISDNHQVGIIKSPISISQHNDFSKFRRAWLAIYHARQSALLQFKIFNYIAALESLFTTNKTELQHKIGERVAVLIGSNGQEKRDIYDQIKSAYDIRSSYVHGGEIGSKSQKDIKDVSRNIDSIVRRAYVKVIMHDWDKLLTNKEVDVYFRDLLFPIDSK